MKSLFIKKTFLVVIGVLILSTFAVYIHVQRTVSSSATGLVKLVIDQMETSLRPYTDADYVLRYSLSEKAFSISTVKSSGEIARIPESELNTYLLSLPTKPAKLLVLCQSADFQSVESKSAFEDRVKSQVQPSSVVFGYRSRVKSLLD